MRSKAEQVVDIIDNMTPNQMGELAEHWLDKSPEMLEVFRRRLHKHESSL